jgi:hypothetical protein
MRTLRSIAPIVSLLFPLACAAGPSEAPDATDEASRGMHSAIAGENPEWSGTIAAGAEVAAYGINGSIRVLAGSGDALSVHAEKHGPDADEIELEVVEAGDRVVICAVYPGGRCDARGYHSAKGKVRTRGRMDVTITMPPDRRLAATTVNGSIDGATTGSVDARTVNGNVTLSGIAQGSGRTVNGSIEAEVGTSLAGDLDLRTVNGRIEVRMAVDTPASVQAKSVNGRIRTDLPLNEERRPVGSRAHGKLNGGGPAVDLQTVNGGIRIESFRRAAAGEVVHARTAVAPDRGEPIDLGPEFPVAGVIM